MPVEQIAACKGCGLEVIKTHYIVRWHVWCPRCGGMNRLVDVEGGRAWECETPGWTVTNHKSLTRKEALQILSEFCMRELIRVREDENNGGNPPIFSARLAMTSLLSGVFKDD